MRPSRAPKERGASVGSDAELADDLEVAVRRGWCEDQARTAPDVMGVGVPLVCGERRFGLAVAGPVYRMQDRREELARALQAAAAAIRDLIAHATTPGKIGRASGRERVCQYV